jgi:hypothetical protein
MMILDDNTSMDSSDTYKNMSYDDFLKIIVRNKFIPMYGCNLRNSITEKMSDEYHISAQLDLGLLLTSESNDNILHESKLYYELDVSLASRNSYDTDWMLDLLRDCVYTPCGSKERSILTIKYNATQRLISHIHMLNRNGLKINNPWEHVDRHDLKILRFNTDRIREGYHTSDIWIRELPKEVQWMIGYIK